MALVTSYSLAEPGWPASFANLPDQVGLFAMATGS